MDMAYLEWRAPTSSAIPLVLLHGLNTHPWAWARVASQLRSSRRVIAPALRGHGNSSTPERGYGLEETTADLAGFLDALGLDRVHLAGHSWGGKVAFHLAARHGARIASLVLADPVLPGGLNFFLRNLTPLRDAAFAPERSTFEDEGALDRGGRQMTYLLAWDDADRKLWHGMFRPDASGRLSPRVPDGVFNEILDHTLNEDVRGLAAGVTCPVLFLQPDFTLSFLPGETGRFTRSLPSCSVRRVPGDHTFIHSNAIDTADEIARFLDGA